MSAARKLEPSFAELTPPAQSEVCALVVQTLALRKHAKLCAELVARSEVLLRLIDEREELLEQLEAMERLVLDSTRAVLRARNDTELADADRAYCYQPTYSESPF